MKTLAVVIGNNDYYGNAKLENAISDAKAIADVFDRLGYDIIYKVDCTEKDIVELLEEFSKKITNYDAIIFYYAGHGFQFEGENYLASIECQVANPSKHHCSRTCITMTEILGILNKHNDKISIIIIDACRRGFDRGDSSAFTPIQAPKGTLIAFSTSPNEGAKDGGLDGHSIYTGALLRYIGREWISVEELFKKVRKTVYNLSDGKQTTWEHTSLIGDFFFNTGQLVYSLNVPYDNSVVKDNEFKGESDEFSTLILKIKSSNWDIQSPAIDKILQFRLTNLDKNQQFILGRNLLQAGGYAFSASNFFNNLKDKLKKYMMEGENHVLNGILFEIYFNSYGEFRKENFKTKMFDDVMDLRKDFVFKKSFDFIRRTLEPYRDILFWIPMEVDLIVDVDILATSETKISYFKKEVTYEIISKVVVHSKDITEQVSKYGFSGMEVQALKGALSNFLAVPKELIRINSNVGLKNIVFSSKMSIINYPF